MPTLRIDNREVEVAAGATILDAARRLGIAIPTLCHKDGYAPNTSCLACIVKVNGGQRLVPSCATAAADGMVVESESEEVRHARRTALELLLSDHAGDCLAPCTNVCPAHMDIPRMIREIASGELREAITTVKRHIALPAVLGRICPDLCEKGCRRAAKDESVSICRLKRYVADVDLACGSPYRPACRPQSGKRVAVVGSGPAGLAAAYYLRQRGHGCTIFERHEQPGGNLRYAVGRDRLPHDVLDAEIATITDLGADIRCGTALGKDVSLSELRGGFDAVLLAVGAIEKKQADDAGVELAGKGVKADKYTLMTSRPGVFAAGACLTPFRHAIRAVADGWDAANAIDHYLLGLPIPHREAPWVVRLGVLSDAENTSFIANASEDPRAPAAPDFCGLSDSQALTESLRCLQCACAKENDCALRRESIRYDANPTKYKSDRKSFERVLTHPELVYEPGKCIACGLCVAIARKAGEPLGLTHVGRGFTVRIDAPFGDSLADALRTAARECAESCPTAALTLRVNSPAVAVRECV